MTDFDPERDPLDLLAEEFTLKFRRGEQPSVADYAQRYPVWADQIRDLFPPVARMEQLRMLRQAERGTAAEATPLRQLGDYRILREVGRGGMGVVYEAVQESLGRRVALKVLPKHSLLDPKNLERFRRESQAAARLHHTNIVPVFGVGEQDGLHYYVMQFIEGQGLNHVLAGLRKDGRRWQQVASIGVQVADALHYAHQQGTLHRDIKPANLLLDQHGTVWVTDFGLAKPIPTPPPTHAPCQPGKGARGRQGAGGGLTDTGDIVGTLRYMAPETLQGRVGPRSDVYSLGLTLYELLTLQPPFNASHPAQLVQQVSEHEPPRPRKLNPAIPRDLETIILKAIAREPERRYQTAGELADDLRRFLDDQPIAARRASPAQRLGRWCRRNRAIASLAAALAVVFLGGNALVIWKWQEAAAERQRAEQHLAVAKEALRGESHQREKAEAATERAERNVDLSLQAFEEIFNQISNRKTLFSSFPNSSLASRKFGDGPSMPSSVPTSSLGPKAVAPFRPPLFAIGSEENAALLQSILNFYDQFAEQNTTNPSLQLEAAKAHRRVRDIQQRLGQVEKAEAADGRATAILEQLVAEFPSIPDYRHELSETYAKTDTRSTEPEGLEKAQRRLQRALEIEEELAAASGIASKYTASRARTCAKLGEVMQQMGRSEEAETAYRQAVALQKSLADQFPTHPFYVFDLCKAHHALAELLRKRDRLAEARSVLEESIADLQKLLTPSPRMRPGSMLLAAHYQSLATIYQSLGESTLAEETSRMAEEIKRNLRPPSGLGRHQSANWGNHSERNTGSRHP